MAFLVLGIILFFGIHTLKPVFSDHRQVLIERLGEIRYKIYYSMIAGIGLGLIIYGYIQADYIWLWSPLPGATMVTFALMVPAALLLVGADFPTSWGKAVKHPMMIGTVIWAIAHLWVNGHVKALLLFGGFGIYAVMILSQADWKKEIKPKPLVLNLLWVPVSIGAYVGVRYLHTI